MAGGPDITIREIAQGLNARVSSLAPELLPNGHRHGRFWQTSSIDDIKTGSYSLKVNLNGARQGCWTDFGAAPGMVERSGDMLTLLALRRFGGAHKEALAAAIAWAKSWLGLDDLDPARLATVRREAAAREIEADADALAETEGKRRYATALWREAVPIAGTPALVYLEGRGIDFARLGRVPGSLRYHPAVWCPVRRGKHPAMVACIMGLDQPPLRGVHRTYLDVSGGKSGPVKAIKIATGPDGKVRVAQPGDLKPKSHKLTIGPYQGGCIPLWKGACPRTLRDLADGVAVYASEGIEDGLSVALASPDRRVVAAVALANLGGLELPPQAGPLVIIGQNDAIDGKAVAAVESAIARQQAGGRAVQTMFPPAGFKDFNDVLMGRRQ